MYLFNQSEKKSRKEVTLRCVSWFKNVRSLIHTDDTENVVEPHGNANNALLVFVQALTDQRDRRFFIEKSDSEC